MYDDHFDDDTDFDGREVIKRAYALGVASVCGDPDHETRYEELRERSPDSYDESLVELAYDEGRAKALELKPDAEDSTEVWETLVETKLRSVDVESGAGPTGLPDALKRSDGEPLTGRRPESLDLPSFLEK